LTEKIFRPIETSIGILKGRDAIYLDTFDFELHGVLKLGGEINGNLASSSIDRFIRYSIIFSDVIVFKVIELDSWDYQFDSSFDEVIDSEWCKTLGGKITPDHKHYQVQTYDYVIEIVASKFNMSIDESIPK
jgi:hypothetical protein